MRPPCCFKARMDRGPWSEEEDAKILDHVAKHGTGDWTSVPKKTGLRRCGRSCRLRWSNHLKAEAKHEFSAEEEDLVIKLHAAIGSRWAIIAQQLPGRTDNDVKNYWNTKLKKKLTEKGIDPVTHRPFSQILRDYDSIGGIPTQSRAGSISKELKNAFYMGRGGMGPYNNHISQKMALKPEPSEGCYSLDLLAQLQAIKLVTEGPSFSPSPFFINGSCSLPTASPSASSSSASSSSSSAYSAATAAAQEIPSTHNSFSWSEFLIEEASLPHTEHAKASEFLAEGSVLQGETKKGDEEEVHHLHHPSSDSFIRACLQASPSSPSSGSSFVEDMLKRDGDMFMAIPELWEEPLY
ncbi:hypothetical protein SAY87_028363 [Trapa incisa]|uniref:Transcription factor MYB35 n=1 Tax=Trapa incisa TaxID=236973 RepID=A0AAN7QNK6_9MYRT|nr:hypothetical protein SAY87_028363 [Trapa incisa]